MSLTNLLPSFNKAPTATRDTESSGALPRTVRPYHEVKETPDAFGVTVFLPGVAKDGLDLTVEEGEVRIVGRPAWKQPEGWTAFHRESADAPFELVLAHNNAIDADKIAAELRDGVLRVSLPKHEALKPRKIAVN